jgi:isopenicillin N synthase-like dioxygenase
MDEIPVEIPVVDISGWWSGDPAGRRRIATAFDDAACALGFLQIVGHGIAPALQAGLREAAGEFFALADDEKRLVAPAERTLNRGWSARLTESLAYTLGEARPGDLVEAFVVGSDHTDNPLTGPGDPYYEEHRARAFAPNEWPARPSGFAERVWAYFTAARALSFDLLDIAAFALGIDASFFRSCTDRAIETMRLNWYRRFAEEVALEPGQMSLGAHTDYGILTLLLADPVPGLQVIGPDGAWHDVIPRDDALVINVGDALAVWTNDRWPSTIHRVVPPPAGSPVRRSFAFFQDGNPDAPLSCLPSCCSAERPARYPATTLGAHLHAKVIGGRAMTDVVDAHQTEGDRVREAL